jgi:hypothetical protein
MPRFIISIQCEHEDLARATLDVHMSVEQIMQAVTLPRGLSSEDGEWTWTLDHEPEDE